MKSVRERKTSLLWLIKITFSIRKRTNYLFTPWNSNAECLNRLVKLRLMRSDCSFSELRAQKYHKQGPNNTALNCFFRWKPLFSQKPALILRFWLARLDPRYVTFRHMTDVNNLERRLCYLANHKRVDHISGNPLNKVLSRVFSLSEAAAFSFDCVMGYFCELSTIKDINITHARIILRKCGRQKLCL